MVKLERQRQQLIDSICDGVPTALIKDRAVRLQQRREELQAILDSMEESPVLFHPNMASCYHSEIRNLIASLTDPAARGGAARLLRSLIDKIVLTPAR